MTSRILMTISFVALSLIAFAPHGISTTTPVASLVAASLATFENPVPGEFDDFLTLAQAAPQHPAAAARARTIPPRRLDLAAEFLDECMEVAEQVNPEWAQRMRSECEKRPEEFARFLRQSGRQLVGLVELKRRDPELYQTKLQELRQEAQLKATLHKLRHLQAQGQGDSADALMLQTELRVLVEQQVIVSLRAKGEYILRLRQHLDAMEDQLKADAANFFKTVDDRHQALIKAPEGS